MENSGFYQFQNYFNRSVVWVDVVDVLDTFQLQLKITKESAHTLLTWNIVNSCSINCADVIYQVYKYEMGISGNRWGTRAVCATNIWHDCRIIPITSRSSWWTCSIVRYVLTMVSPFQKWWLRQQTSKKKGTWKTPKKIRRCGRR